MIEIRERDFEGFFSVPFNVYGEKEHYVSPMKADLRKMLSEQNPLFSGSEDFTYLTAFENGTAVGRIVVHIHHASNTRHQTEQASFGFFDCRNCSETARLLLQSAETWAREQGMSEIAGNFNLTAMQQCGVQTDGFEKPGYTDMVQNPQHIPQLLRENCFEPYFPMTTFEVDLAEATFTGKELPDASRYTFQEVEKKGFKQRMEEARAVLNDGFEQNPMFVPLTPKEFIFQAGEMMTILDPRLSSVVKLDGRPVGVVICIPDLNGFLKATRSKFGISTPFHYLKYRLGRHRAVIIFYSVASAQHGLGIMGAILDQTVSALKGAGYRQLGVTWIADANKPSLRQVEKLGAKPLHRLHLFKKSLS
ncbi:GNAT family N-acetyltransferase [Roseibium sediminis]|uniref:GNAT family N-acetyltransferase n=1 Tax=Roseibium sediminis TaxID=1775174 RepID=UPI00123E1CF6|nr:GNAT family N-acetyltransferase [Roseibium sediminis]